MDPLLEFLLKLLPYIIIVILAPLVFEVVKLVIDFLRYRASTYYAETGSSFIAVRFDTGAFGEYQTTRRLEQVPGHKRFLINAYVPKENGKTSECDVIMLHASGVYVFESKNYGGWIFGNEDQQYWTQRFSNGHKERFFNPCMQNAAHINALQQRYPDIAPEAFISVVVFSERCRLRGVTVHSGRVIVSKREHLIAAITPHLKHNLFVDQDIERMYATMKALTSVTDAVKEQHVQQVADVAEHRTCPWCGKSLVLRTRRKSGTRFWGCAGYPTCKYTAPYGGTT